MQASETTLASTSDTRRETRSTPLFVDAHVHFYRSFDETCFLDAAWSNFSKHARGEHFVGLLLLAETARDDWFGSLSKRAEGATTNVSASPSWRPIATAEGEALRLRQPDGRELYVLAGRQIVTAEDLELLALGTTQRFEDGSRLADLTPQVLASGAIAVLPWGFGKWTGRRGEIVRREVNEAPSTAFFLGDNGGRLRGSREPAVFAAGKARGLRVLPGSDPLPLRSEQEKAGHRGFQLSASFDAERPALALRRALVAADCTLESFGRGETLWRFVLNQVSMQRRKRFG